MAVLSLTLVWLLERFGSLGAKEPCNKVSSSVIRLMGNKTRRRHVEISMGLA